MRTWKPAHGNLRFTHDEQRRVYGLVGERGWRGGYVVPTDISRYRVVNVLIRNLSGRPNSVAVELKQEGTYLLGSKVRVALPADADWHVVEIPINQIIRLPLNYLAFSDPEGSLEIATVSFSK